MEHWYLGSIFWQLHIVFLIKWLKSRQYGVAQHSSIGKSKLQAQVMKKKKITRCGRPWVNFFITSAKNFWFSNARVSRNTIAWLRYNRWPKSIHINSLIIIDFYHHQEFVKSNSGKNCFSEVWSNNKICHYVTSNIIAWHLWEGIFAQFLNETNFTNFSYAACPDFTYWAKIDRHYIYYI